MTIKMPETVIIDTYTKLLALKNPITMFKTYHTDSVYLLLLSCVGKHGTKSKELAISIMKKFIEYVNDNKKMYGFPITFYLPLYNPELLTKIVEWSECTNIILLNNNINHFTLLTNKIDTIDYDLNKHRITYKIRRLMQNEFVDKHKLYILSIIIGIAGGIFVTCVQLIATLID